MDRENFMCDQCPSVFISKSHLNHHIKRVHLETLGKRNPDFVDSIPCSSCAEKFSAGNLYIRQGLLKIWTEHFPHLVFFRNYNLKGLSEFPWSTLWVDFLDYDLL